MLKRVLHNGIFLTTEGEAAAVAIDESGVIARVLQKGDPLPEAPEHVDMQANFVIPAFEDAHNHLATRARTTIEIDLRKENISWKEAKGRISARIATTPKNEWVVCHGWNETAWGEIEREEVDEISREHGILLINISYHGGLINTKGIELLAQGGVHVAASGKITENEFDAVAIATSPKKEAYMVAIPQLQDRLLGLGIGAMHDMNILTFEQLEAYRELDAQGKLKFPVMLYLNARLLSEPEKISAYLNTEHKMAQIKGVKLYMDGAIGVSTAAVNEPYTDGTGSGFLRLEESECEQKIAQAAAIGLKHVAIHCIGDSAIDRAVRVMDTLQEKYIGSITTWRFEHFEMPSDDAIKTVARCGAIASMQPNFSWDVANYANRLGERISTINPLRTVLDTGAILAIGSDDAPTGPLIGMQWATSKAPYQVQQLTPAEALRSYTEVPARIVDCADKRGKIAIGYEANFTVLDRNPLDERTWEENTISVREVWVRGEHRFTAR